ncbi:MAG: hypothetical protein WBA13_19125 [Microcoleaceae cyanobacterium]
MRHKKLIFSKSLLLLFALLLVPLTACQIEKEESGSLPDIDVNVEPGSLPEYDIEGPDVNVGTTEKTITVPKLVVIQEEETIEVPYIDIDVPGAQREERTITTEVEVPTSGYTLDITDIYAVNNQLWVISQLTETDPNAPQASMRVSDRVVLNAPDSSIRHYVIGERPQGSFNEQYTFINDRQAIASQLESGRQIYQQL